LKERGFLILLNRVSGHQDIRVQDTRVPGSQVKNKSFSLLI
jgi:hypothetical protein